MLRGFGVFFGLWLYSRRKFTLQVFLVLKRMFLLQCFLLIVYLFFLFQSRDEKTIGSLLKLLTSATAKLSNLGKRKILMEHSLSIYLKDIFSESEGFFLIPSNFF